MPQKASIPNSSDSESIGSSVQYEDSDNEVLKRDDSDILEPNDSDDDSQYQSEDPDAPSPHYSPPGTAQGTSRTAYSFTPAAGSASPHDDTTPRVHQTGFDDVLIVNPESRRPSAQSDVNTGFENDFNPKGTQKASAHIQGGGKRSSKHRTKDKQKGDILGALPLTSALASLGLGMRSSRRQSAADTTYGNEESEQRLKRWGRSRGLSF